MTPCTIYYSLINVIDMSQVERSQEYSIFQDKCKNLLNLPKIRFAGLINHMGKLVAGGFKGVDPIEDDAERQKMYTWN